MELTTRKATAQEQWHTHQPALGLAQTEVCGSLILSEATCKSGDGGQGDGEGRAVTFNALHIDGTTMFFDDLLADC